MNRRRLIGSILALALLAGQTFVPLARAACATSMPTSTTSCAWCQPESTSGSSASFALDRSCCAAPASITDREPATIAPDRAGDPRIQAVAVLASAGLLVSPAPSWVPQPAPGAPDASPPQFRTAILLI